MIRNVGSAPTGTASTSAEGARASPPPAVRLQADRLVQLHNAPMRLQANAPGRSDFHFAVMEDGSVTAIRRVVAASPQHAGCAVAQPDGSAESRRILADRGQRLAQAWAGAINDWVHQGATALRDDARQAMGAAVNELAHWKDYVRIAKVCLEGDLSDLTQSERLSEAFGLDRPLPPELLATLQRSLAAQIAAAGPVDAQRRGELDRACDLIKQKLAGTARDALRDPLLSPLFDALHAWVRDDQSTSNVEASHALVRHSRAKKNPAA